MDGPTRTAVDPDGLARYLKRDLPQFESPFVVERLGEGQSCLTFMVSGPGWRIVLRRPPRGDLPPTAFDVTREYRVMRALREHDALVPVPRVLSLCDDLAVIGAPFYLMEPVDGLVVRTELPAELGRNDDHERMSKQLVDTLLALHAVDPVAVGLESFGKPEGYLERQLRRMRGLWELARFRDIPDVDEVGTWLEDHLPGQSPAGIVHGDYKLDNVIFAPRSPARLIAVVDWEMSAIGDPLADLGWLLYFWRDPGDPRFGLRVATVTDLPGFLRRRDLLDRYTRGTDRDVQGIRWYMALAGWKIAIIMEGSYRRFLAGIADHPAFAELEEAVPGLARRALECARGTLSL